MKIYFFFSYLLFCSSPDFSGKMRALLRKDLFFAFQWKIAYCMNALWEQFGPTSFKKGRLGKQG